MAYQPTNRWSAFGIHLLISVFVFIVLAAIIIFVWYPGFLFKTDGGWQGIRLIAGIDLILGPLLTLIVYNSSKKSLTFDLSCIAIVQILALAYGTHLVYSERPIAVIFADGHFITASQNSYSFYGINTESINIIQKNKKPVWIYVDLPPLMQGEKKQDRYNRIGPEHLWVKGYMPFTQNINKLEGGGVINIEGLPSIIEQAHQHYFRLLTRYYEGYLLMDLQNGDVLTIVITKNTDSYGIKQSL